MGSIDHQVVIETLAERTHDGRFPRLVRNMLEAGYMKEWTWGATLSGMPQDGSLSPLLSSIYLHQLESFVEKIPILHCT
ncbi:hypothetical protein ACFV97_13785 [Streptomyces sp. NPDC059913]|uniref:hypothetical protein n=1 Tax=unclassified Streptomyces TaxID=2593676 RepID=UPI00365B22AA